MNNKSLDALFSGLTEAVAPQSNSLQVGSPTKAEEGKGKTSKAVHARKKRATEERHEERFCVIVDSELLKKVRIIARQEGMHIKEIIAVALSNAINSYEKKNGIIKEEPKKKPEDLF